MNVPHIPAEEKVSKPLADTSTSSNSGIRILFYIYLVLIVIGGLNWGLVAIDKNLDLVEMVGKAVQGVSYSLTSRIVYGLVGICALLTALLSIANPSAIFATN